MKKIFRPTIIKVKYYYDGTRKIKWVINWLDANNTKRRSVGVALKYPSDSPCRELGKHIAESRAKADMFKKHLDSLTDVTLTLGFGCNIYQDALKQEICHIEELTHYES